MCVSYHSVSSDVNPFLARFCSVGSACDFVVQARRVARSATPVRSEGSLAGTEKIAKKIAGWGLGSKLMLFSPFFRGFIAQCCVQSLAVVVAYPYLESLFYSLYCDIVVQVE